MKSVFFGSLPVGSVFWLPFVPACGRYAMRKIEPEFIPKGKIREDLYGKLSYTAEYAEGPYKGQKCVVTTGSDKEPRLVLVPEHESVDLAHVSLD